jgi:hypothetical protein
LNGRRKFSLSAGRRRPGPLWTQGPAVPNPLPEDPFFKDGPMDALYMIVAFIVVMAVLNLATTGRLD